MPIILFRVTPPVGPTQAVCGAMTKVPNGRNALDPTVGRAWPPGICLRIGREVHGLVFSVFTDVAFEGPQIARVVQLGQSHEPHRSAALRARRLKGWSGLLGKGTWLGHYTLPMRIPTTPNNAQVGT